MWINVSEVLKQSWGVFTKERAGSRGAAISFLQQRQAVGEIVTGLLYVDPNPRDLHAHLGTSDTPLNALREDTLVPGSTALAKINAGLR